MKIRYVPPDDTWNGRRSAQSGIVDKPPRSQVKLRGRVERLSIRRSRGVCDPGLMVRAAVETCPPQPSDVAGLGVSDLVLSYSLPVPCPHNLVPSDGQSYIRSNDRQPLFECRSPSQPSVSLFCLSLPPRGPRSFISVRNKFCELFSSLRSFFSSNPFALKTSPAGPFLFLTFPFEHYSPDS